MTEEISDQNQVLSVLGDVNWRIRNLYKIKDKEGQVVDFCPNWAQQALQHPHYLNIILKARACALSLTRGGTSRKTTTRNDHLPCDPLLGHLPV